jgi:uncharacterized protein (AIM24 family)
MKRVRAIDGGGSDLLNDEFMQQLYRGGELLTEGKVIEAREHLERAVQLDPSNEKCQNLLGLTYFKLGVFDKAAETYGRLVSANPADPTLRVNLGLVFLKTNFLARAIREFETAIDLAPDHKKAHNYLGLALAQAAEYERAREHFLLAGSDVMAERMTRTASGMFVGEETDTGSDNPPAQIGSPPMESSGAVESENAEVGMQVYDLSGEEALLEGGQGSMPLETEEVDWGAQLAGEWGAAPQDQGSESVTPGGEYYPVDSPAMLNPMIVPPDEVPMEAPAGHGATPTVPSLLRELAPAVQLLQQPLSTVFQIGPQAVVVSVNGQLLTRLSGLVAYCGNLGFAAERKRFRDRTTDRWFGEGEGRMVRAQGEGTLLFRMGGKVFVPIDLGGDSAYLREETVFALENSLGFENGRLPAPFAADLDLVHVRGKGVLLLRLDGPMHSLEVSLGRPVTVPLERLVGWQGHLTPRISALLPDDDGRVHKAGLELSGEGFALLTLPLD